jgi:hypothetical protein
MNRKFFTLVLFGGLTIALVALLAQTSTTPTVHAMNLAPLPRTQAGVSDVTASTTTTTTLVSSINPAPVGQTVTFTATVRPAPGSGTPTGTVQFKVDGVNFGAPVNLSGRKASFSTSWSAKWSHNITAVYSGDTNFSASTSATKEQCVECSSFNPIYNNSNSFILSNEPNYLIHKLVAAGYGNYNLYDCVLAIRNDTMGTGLVITDAFLQALANAPAGAEIFTKQLGQFDFEGAVAVSDNGTARIVDVYGQDYSGKPNTITLRTETSGVSKSNFVYSNNSSVPLTSWIDSDSVGPVRIITTYNAFAVAWVGNYNAYLPLVVK